MVQPRLEAKDFPQSFDSFLSFVGRQELEKAVKRVKRKISDTPSALRNLFGERYFFHEALDYFLSKPNDPLDVADIKAVRAASLIQGLLHIRENISEESQNRLRRMIHGNLQPNNDFRNLEAEVICCIHLVYKGWAVSFPDFDGEARYDCLASRLGEEVEFECKNLSLDTNPRIKPELRITLLKTIVERLKQNKRVPCSIVVLKFNKPPHLTEKIDEKVIVALDSYPAGTTTDEFSLEFFLRPAWEDYVTNKTPDEFRAFAKSDVLLNSGDHYIRTFDSNRIIATIIIPDKDIDLVTKIQDLISNAAKQFSTRRPSVVWIHLNGIPPEEFVAIAQQSERDVQSALSAVAAGALFSGTTNTKPFVNAVRFTVVDKYLSDRKAFTNKGLLADAIALNGRLFDASPYYTKYNIKSDF